MSDPRTSDPHQGLIRERTPDSVKIEHGHNIGGGAAGAVAGIAAIALLAVFVLMMFHWVSGGVDRLSDEITPEAPRTAPLHPTDKTSS